MTLSDSPAGRLVGFKRHLRAEAIKGDGVYLLSERGVTALKGAHLEALAPLLDGTRNLDALLRDLPAGVSAEQVAGLLVRLADAGLVTMRSPVAPTQPVAAEPTLSYWEACDLDPGTAVADTVGQRLQLITLGGVDGPQALTALREAGLSATPSDAATHDPGAADFTVVLCEDYLDPRLGEIDAAHRAADRPWLLAKPAGTQVWIGPVFDPSLPCWHCLAARLWGHRQAEAQVQAALGRQGPAPRPTVSVPPLAAGALHLTALEATKWLAGYRYPGQRSVWTFDSFDLRGRHHEVHARPQCPSCGDPTIVRAAMWQPVLIASRPKASYTANSHRSMPPQQVFDRYRHLISPVTGVVKEIRRDTRGPEFLNSFRAGPNLAVGIRSMDSLRAALRAENGGKGITPLHGKVSALCEALERHSGHFHGDEERVRGSFDSLGEQAVHPDTCQLFHERQYADRTRWNASHSAFQYVCDPFDPSAVMDWTPVWSLTQQRHRLLPTGLLYFNAPTESGSMPVRADSNGNAAGSSMEDAVLQGMLELVERDAVAQWWYNRTRQPAVDLDACGDPWVDELREVYQGLGREVWMLDLTSDLNIPTMVALSRRTDKPCEDIMFGFGAHLDPWVAIRRALTEMNQLMPTVAEVGPDDEYGFADPEATNWWRQATVREQPYLLPDTAQRPRTPADFHHRPTEDLREDVTSVQTRMEALDLEVLVLDQTRPDIGLPVVKVVVPGMRGFWARFAPGRLYDVPVRLGRLREPTAYEDLNPIPLFV